jgi:hypothetical protein
VPFVPWPSESTWDTAVPRLRRDLRLYGLLIRSYEIEDLSLVYPIARGSAHVLSGFELRACLA